MGGPLFKAGFRQGEIVVTMGDELGPIPASGVRPSNDDDGNPLARAQRERRHRSKEAVLVESIDRAHEAEDGTSQVGVRLRLLLRPLAMRRQASFESSHNL